MKDITKVRIPKKFYHVMLMVYDGKKQPAGIFERPVVGWRKLYQQVVEAHAGEKETYTIKLYGVGGDESTVATGSLIMEDVINGQTDNSK